jgi:hypothetical protein
MYNKKIIKGKEITHHGNNFTLSIVNGNHMFRLYITHYQVIKIEMHEMGGVCGYVVRMGRREACTGFSGEI